jgi:hypothetical protein
MLLGLPAVLASGQNVGLERMGNDMEGAPRVQKLFDGLDICGTKEEYGTFEMQCTNVRQAKISIDG